jgi:hypothetical protein
MKKQYSPPLFDAREWRVNGVADFANCLFSIGCGCELRFGKMAFVEGLAVTDGRRRNCLFTTNCETVHLVAMRYRWINRHRPPDRKCCPDRKDLQGSRSMRPALE